MKKQVNVEINPRHGSGVGATYQPPKPHVKVVIIVEADEVDHAIADLDVAHKEVIAQFDAREQRAGTTPINASSFQNVARRIHEAGVNVRDIRNGDIGYPADDPTTPA